MSRKTNIVCDVCSDTILLEDEITVVQTKVDKGVVSYDVCKTCVLGILNRSFIEKGWKDKPLRPFCNKCKGKGYTREVVNWDYHRNEYGKVACEVCAL